MGADVLDAMRTNLPDADRAFAARSPGKYLADLFELGRQALAQACVERVYGGHDCTFSDPARFYSFRRDRTTGRRGVDLARLTSTYALRRIRTEETPMPTSTLAAAARRSRKKAQPARRAAASRSGAAPPKPAASQAPTNSRPAAYALPPSPDQLMQLQQDYLTQLASLWTDFFQNPAKSSEPIADSRFSDPAWQSNSLASFYARAYLLIRTS